jgi:CubicO group peptidase (beta-lactamase class C family)
MTAIAIHGSCDPRFTRVRELFQNSLDAGSEIGAAVAFVLDGECVVDLWGGHYDLERTREWQRDIFRSVGC